MHALGKIKGLLTHTNVRKDKSDCYPDPNLSRYDLKFINMAIVNKVDLKL